MRDNGLHLLEKDLENQIHKIQTTLNRIVTKRTPSLSVTNSTNASTLWILDVPLAANYHQLLCDWITETIHFKITMINNNNNNNLYKI